MAEWLIAAPGTPADGPGWHEPPPGMTLRWTIDGERPPVAVKRDGVLVATGLPLYEECWPDAMTWNA